MAEQVIRNNVAEIIGELCENFVYSHEVFGEKFYVAPVRIPRLSSSFDYIPLMVSERLLNPSEPCRGRLIHAVGQFRSYNKHLEGHSKLVLSVFAREVDFPEFCEKSPNSIFLDGYICKEPIYRRIPLGREIADLLLAVNRPYNKSDYIPAIAWGRNARFAGSLKVGDRIRLWGRMQSRIYQKKLDEDRTEQRTAYEVSVSKLEKVGAEEAAQAREE